MILLHRFSSMLTLFIHHLCPILPPFPYPQTQALQILEALALHARSYHNDKQHKLYAIQFPILSLLMLAKPIPQVTGLLLACHNNHSSNFSLTLVNRVLLVNHTEKIRHPGMIQVPSLIWKPCDKSGRCAASKTIHVHIVCGQLGTNSKSQSKNLLAFK
jgi:hypothetical protein